MVVDEFWDEEMRVVSPDQGTVATSRLKARRAVPTKGSIEQAIKAMRRR